MPCIAQFFYYCLPELGGIFGGGSGGGVAAEEAVSVSASGNVNGGVNDDFDDRGNDYDDDYSESIDDYRNGYGGYLLTLLRRVQQFDVFVFRVYMGVKR